MITLRLSHKVAVFRQPGRDRCCGYQGITETKYVMRLSEIENKASGFAVVVPKAQQRRFLNGGCFVFAIALARLLRRKGYAPRLYGLFDGDNLEHAFVVVDGKAYDCRGELSLDPAIIGAGSRMGLNGEIKPITIAKIKSVADLDFTNINREIDWYVRFFSDGPGRREIMDSDPVLNEKIVGMIKGYGGDYPVYKNGSFVEFERQMDRLTPTDADDDSDYPRPADPGTMRGLLDPDSGDFYFWDGFGAAHGGIKDLHGLPRSFHLILRPDKVNVLTLWRYERDGYSAQDVHDLVSHNPNIQRVYRNGFTVTVQP